MPCIAFRDLCARWSFLNPSDLLREFNAHILDQNWLGIRGAGKHYTESIVSNKESTRIVHDGNCEFMVARRSCFHFAPLQVLRSSQRHCTIKNGVDCQPHDELHTLPLSPKKWMLQPANTSLKCRLELFVGFHSGQNVVVTRYPHVEHG